MTMLGLIATLRLLIASMYSKGEIDTATASELAQRCNKLQLNWQKAGE